MNYLLVHGESSAEAYYIVNFLQIFLELYLIFITFLNLFSFYNFTILYTLLQHEYTTLFMNVLPHKRKRLHFPNTQLDSLVELPFQAKIYFPNTQLDSLVELPFQAKIYFIK